MVGKNLANLEKAIDLIAPEFLNLSIREALEINCGCLFARLLRSLLFFFKRILRGVIVVVHTIRFVNMVVVVV